MADIADAAKEADDCFQEEALARARAFRAAPVAQSAANCVVCGDPISEARRRAVKNCNTCIDCQLDIETRSRR